MKLSFKLKDIRALMKLWRWWQWANLKLQLACRFHFLGDLSTMMTYLIIRHSWTSTWERTTLTGGRGGLGDVNSGLCMARAPPYASLSTPATLFAAKQPGVQRNTKVVLSHMTATSKTTVTAFGLRGGGTVADIDALTERCEPCRCCHLANSRIQAPSI